MDRCFPSAPLASPRSWRTYSRTEYILMDILVDSRIMEVPELRGRQHTVRRRRQEAVVRLLGGVLYREHTTLVLPKPRAFTFIQFCHSMAILGASHKHVSHPGISIPPQYRKNSQQRQFGFTWYRAASAWHFALMSYILL